MNKLTKAFVGTCMVMTAGCGNHGSAESKADQLHQARANLEFRLESRRIAAANIGAPCVAALGPYTDGELQDLSEDSVVIDLTSNPDYPCGTVPADIRHKFRIMDAHDAAVRFALADVEHARE